MAHSDSDASNRNERTALREMFRAARQALDAPTHHTHGVRLVEHWLALKAPITTGATVGLYLTRDGEIDSGPLRDALMTRGIDIALPCIDQAARQLSWRRYEGHARLVTGPYGIPEPDTRSRALAARDLAVLFVPLVAFDDRGTRLGMGGGYYDRYLGALPAAERPVLIGLAHNVQRSPRSLPRAAWDVPLDAVLTESGVTQFSRALLR